MRKPFFILLFFLTLTACGKQQPESSVLETAAPTEHTESAVQTPEAPHEEITCTLAMDKPIVWDNAIKITEYSAENAPWKPFRIPEGQFVFFRHLIDGMFYLGIDGEEDSYTDLITYDPKTDKFETHGAIPFKFAYNNTKVVLQNRYIGYLTSYYGSSEAPMPLSASTETTEEPYFDLGLESALFIFDTQTGTVKAVDRFGAHNIVEYAAPVGDDGVAYCYYERFTEDWVVKYYNLAEDTVTELYRHTNFNENDTLSQMGVISDGTNIALVVQYKEDFVSYTKLEWFSKDGEWLRTEHLPLYEAFGECPFAIDYIGVKGNYYCITYSYSMQTKTGIFYRDGDTFYPLDTGDYKLGKFSISNVSGELFHYKLNFSKAMNTEKYNAFAYLNFDEEVMENHTIPVSGDVNITHLVGIDLQGKPYLLRDNDLTNELEYYIIP